jgi:hypothetical protein
MKTRSTVALVSAIGIVAVAVLAFQSFLQVIPGVYRGHLFGGGVSPDCRAFYSPWLLGRRADGFRFLHVQKTGTSFIIVSTASNDLVSRSMRHSRGRGRCRCTHPAHLCAGAVA